MVAPRLERYIEIKHFHKPTSCTGTTWTVFKIRNIGGCEQAVGAYTLLTPPTTDGLAKRGTHVLDPAPAPPAPAPDPARTSAAAELAALSIRWAALSCWGHTRMEHVSKAHARHPTMVSADKRTLTEAWRVEMTLATRMPARNLRLALNFFISSRAREISCVLPSEVPAATHGWSNTCCAE